MRCRRGGTREKEWKIGRRRSSDKLEKDEKRKRKERRKKKNK